MNQTAKTTTYIKFIEFLMFSKHQIYELAAQHGLSGMQAITVCFLDQTKPMHSFNELFGCDPSNVSGIIGGLELKGLVRRFEEPSDHRIKMVDLSSAGQDVRSELLAKLCGPKSSLLAKLSPAETAQFTKLITKLTQV